MGWTSSKDKFMTSNFWFFCDQSNIKEIFIVSQFIKCTRWIWGIFIPSKAIFVAIRCGHFWVFEENFRSIFERLGYSYSWIWWKYWSELISLTIIFWLKSSKRFSIQNVFGCFHDYLLRLKSQMLNINILWNVFSKKWFHKFFVPFVWIL